MLCDGHWVAESFLVKSQVFRGGFHHEDGVVTFRGDGRVRPADSKAEPGRKQNKAGYTATEVACGWAGAIFEVTRPFGQEQ